MAVPGLVWLGGQAQKYVDKQIDKLFTEAGKAAVAKSQTVVHVRTGRLRKSIGFTYRQSDRTLQIHADEFYAVWEELGTRYHGPHPFLAPGLEVAASILGNPGFRLRAASFLGGRSLGAKTEMHFTNVRATKTHPSKRGLARIHKNASMTLESFRRMKQHAPTIVFHGDHPGSLLGFKIPHRHCRKY